MARKILLADDSVTAQNMGRKILVDAGYEVIAVNNGSAALKKIAEVKPDLVILDVYMPGYSGLEVCQRLKESQETARIPVLLTVGKLEPFKPEEAQRVRAEGFIVKPFEASELLSTLSKLEDKVVPRAEPSKPGRFARAIAAAEESGRAGRTEAGSGDDNGWKTRIGFPKQKTEPEQEKVADEAPSYNPVNRDFRTVVETFAEQVAQSETRSTSSEEKQRPAEKTTEPSLDVAALVPPGLPKDVTPEEVAAIAAAAAQMQMVVSALKKEEPVSAAQLTETQVTETQATETRTTDTQIAETATQKSSEPAPVAAESNLPSLTEIQSGSAPAAESEAKTDAPAESKIESKEENKPEDGAAAARRYYRRKDDVRPDEVRPDETQDVPVTMAATAESVVAASAGRSRWTAVSVALEGSEAAISLDHEMQKAFAASAAAGASGVATVLPVEPASGSSSVLAQAAVEPPAPISIPEPAPVPEPESPKPTAQAEPEPISVASPEPVAIASSFVTPDATSEPSHPSVPSIEPGQQPETAASAPITSEIPPAVSPGETSPTVAFAEPAQEAAAIAESAHPVAEREIAEPAASLTPDPQPRPEPEPAVAEAATASSATIISGGEDVAEKSAFEPPQEPTTELAAEPKIDAETVKSTAAAWASWRQVRDVSKTSDAAEAQPRELDLPETAPADTAARAVAAGAEQILQEAAAAAGEGDQNNVASIVDSVLADLRPKLMEEINRKMSKKK